MTTATLVGEIAGEYITELQRGYLKDRSSAVATLAMLRRGAGKVPEEVPSLFGVAGIERVLTHPELPPTEDVRSRAEAAMFLTVTLYALHQQSKTVDGMHRPGAELGAAVRRLMPDPAADEPIRRRFVRLGTATTRAALADRLREIVKLLRQQSFPLDYALLAQQIYQAQHPAGLRLVRQQWGRSFHAYRPDSPKDDDR